jgi:CheY-like chemotaxis protein
VTLLRAAIDSAVELRLELSESLASIEGDAGQLQQIIMNLVLNGAEAIESGAGAVTVRTRNEVLREPLNMEEQLGYPLLPGAYAVVEVTDSGPGMSGETRRKIFDPFFTTKPGGRGLGLAAVHGIVRGHRGGIVVDSAPGAGTRFVLYFPAEETPAVAAASPSAAPLPAGAGQTILIIDDEAGVRETAADILTVGGYTVRAAAGGVAGVAMFKTEIERIALVLLDLSMPGMSGGETLEMLRDIDPGVRILLSSGYSPQQIIRRLDGAEQLRFIQKPYTPVALLSAVSEALAPDS